MLSPAESSEGKGGKLTESDRIALLRRHALRLAVCYGCGLPEGKQGGQAVHFPALCTPKPLQKHRNSLCFLGKGGLTILR